MLHGYSESAQARLVRAGIERLHDAGADGICAFRAGGWAASLATLRALEQNGIVYDSSLNAAFSASFPDMDESVRNAFTQPVRLGGIWEFPVTSFIDRPPAGRRPLHVCAASLSEFRTVLEHAFEHDWFAVVIVLHSFEFVRVNRIASGSEPASQRLLVDRFERLCTYLSENADRFETSTFSGLREDALPETEQPLVATSSRTRTVMRQIQQLASVFY